MAVEVLMRLTLNTYQFTFFKKPLSVANNQLRIFPHLLPFLVGVALECLGQRKAQLFCHTGGFLLCPQECTNYDTCRLPIHLELHLTP